MENQVIINILALSIVAQVATAAVAVLQLRHVRHFRYAWLLISAAMILMIETRVTPFIDAFNGHSTNRISAIIATLVSLLFFYGIKGLKRLFEHMDNQERELQDKANIDFLTGARTRRAFLDQANQEFLRARRGENSLSILMLDIDHFKQINDTYGHLTGDTALRHFSMLCSHSIREIDLIGRVGGEEFCILLPDTAESGALRVAERIRQSIEKSVIQVASHSSVRFTVSIGIATIAPSDTGVSDMQMRADLALYSSKHNGRNRVTPSGSDMVPSPITVSERKLKRVV